MATNWGGWVRILPLCMLVACGGGHDRQLVATPADGQSPLRARALTAMADVAPEEAARRLLDFAERQYPTYFPSRRLTQSLPPFAYRHYEETGIYLGVAVAAGLGYEPMGVYVMGGPFGQQPVFVGPLAQFIRPDLPNRLVKLHAGTAGNYALTMSGELFATGIGIGCRLGDGTATDRAAPVSLGLGWVDVTGSDRLLALKSDGSLWGWGQGGIGDGTTAMRCQPTRIGDGYRRVHAYAAGSGGAIAVKTDGSLWVWGLEPTRVGTDTDWVDAVAGSDHYLALKADGSLWSFGSSIMGDELGRDSSGESHGMPGRVGSAHYRAIAAGLDTSYAVTTAGELQGWGRSSFLWPLGDGATTDRSRPVPIGSGYVSVHPANTRVVALKQDVSVWAWGENGQFGGRPVGDGSQVPRNEPVQVASGFESLGNSEQSVLGIDRNGDAWGWDAYDYVRHLPSGNFGVQSSRVPLKFDFFAP